MSNLCNLEYDLQCAKISGSSGTHIVCCCVYCQNPTLALQGSYYYYEVDFTSAKKHLCFNL